MLERVDVAGSPATAVGLTEAARALRANHGGVCVGMVDEVGAPAMATDAPVSTVGLAEGHSRYRG